jgi:hypothetical protein
VLLVVLLSHDNEGGTGDGSVKTLRRDLDTLGGDHFLVMLVGRLDAEFTHGVRREESTDVGRNRTVETAHHDAVAFVKYTVHEDDVDGRTQTLDHLHFQHRRLFIVRSAR